MSASQRPRPISAAPLAPVPPAEAEVLDLEVLVWEACEPLPLFEKYAHEEAPSASSAAAAAVPNIFTIIAFSSAENRMAPRKTRALYIVWCLLWLACSAAAQVDPSIVGKLREGGLVLYVRHTSTDFSQNDAAMTSYEDCAHQRNLTDKGRAEAREIGAHVKRLGIPLGEVLASPFCRTMETARLAFGRAQAMNEVRGGPAQPEDPRRYDELRKLLSTPVKKGENRVISSHGNPFHAVAGPPYLAEGEMAVVRPEGRMRFTVIGRIRPQDWPELR